VHLAVRTRTQIPEHRTRELWSHPTSTISVARLIATGGLEGRPSPSAPIHQTISNASSSAIPAHRQVRAALHTTQTLNQEQPHTVPRRTGKQDKRPQASLSLHLPCFLFFVQGRLVRTARGTGNHTRAHGHAQRVDGAVAVSLGTRARGGHPRRPRSIIVLITYSVWSLDTRGAVSYPSSVPSGRPRCPRPSARVRPTGRLAGWPRVDRGSAYVRRNTQTWGAGGRGEQSPCHGPGIRPGRCPPLSRPHAREGDGCAGMRRQRRFPSGAACALDGDADGCVPPVHDDRDQRPRKAPGMRQTFRQVPVTRM
jgi:hypothetical protein